MKLPLTEKPLAKRPYLAGALFWIVFSFVAVLVRGVQWDENYEFAQVLLGQVPYPEDHPLYQYVHGFYSLQTYLLAGLMYFLPGPFVANLLRNWLFLVASTVPVFLLGTLFSRRQMAGHAAAIFILLKIHVTFYSTYPIHVWPGVFSNGPIGLGYMLFTLWALLDRRFRLAGLLLGLAPAIHLGQFPPLLAISLLYAAHLARSRQSRHLWNLVAFAAPGLLVCVAFAMFLYEIAPGPPVDGPYFTPVEPDVLWRTYMERYASHRRIPLSTGHLVLAAAAITGLALLAFRWLRIIPPGSGDEIPPLDAPRAWGALYCAAVCLLVWGIMAVHYATGPDVPYLLTGWLPYRLMNHISPVLIPLLLAIGYDRDNRIPAYLPLLLLAPLLAPLLQFVASLEFMRRYVTPNAYVYFLLFGAAAGTGIVLAWRHKRAYVLWAGGGTAVLLVLLAWFHQFGAACTALGVLMPLAPALSRIPERVTQVASTVLGVVLLIAMLGRAWEQRVELPRTAFHQAVAEYLADQGESDAMILVSYNQVGNQMKFGHPVMADMATLFHGIYRPEIAPSVNAIFEDFYGISLDPENESVDPTLKWYEVWPRKTRDEWQALGKKYRIRYVAAPGFMDLPLEQVLVRGGGILYRIP